MQQHSSTFNAADVTVLGTTRSAKMRLSSVKKAFPIYKKQYWIAREMSGVLEFYKNDQDPQAKGSVRAAQIKGVSFSGDKQNKFFDLSVQLRGGIERRFRLNSREERNRWYAVISSMANRHSSQSQWNGVVTAIQRRLASASSISPYRFVVDMEGIGGAPTELLQYCIEAIDRGVEFTHSIAKTLGTAAGLKDSAVAVAAPAPTVAAAQPLLPLPREDGAEAGAAGADATAAGTTSAALQPSNGSAASSGGAADVNPLDAPNTPGPAPPPPAFASLLPFESVKIVLLNGNLFASHSPNSRSPPLYGSLSSAPPAVTGSLESSGAAASGAGAGSGATGTGGSDPQQAPTLTVPTDAELQRAANAATRFDPLSKQLNLAIMLVLDPVSGDVAIKHMALHKVVSMLQSNVWRNPVIEGWLSQDPYTQEFLEELNELLDGDDVSGDGKLHHHQDRRSSDGEDEENSEPKSNPASDSDIHLIDGKKRRHRRKRRGGATSLSSTANSNAKPPFVVTMQWGHDMESIDEVRLEEYLREHVSYLLLEEVTAAVQQLFVEFPGNKKDGDGQGGLRQVGSLFRTSSSSAGLFRDASSHQMLGGDDGAGCDDEMEKYLPSAQECLKQYVVGVAVCLDRSELEQNIPPQLELLHRMWGDRDLNTGTIVMAKLHRLRPSPEGTNGRNPLSASNSQNSRAGVAATISPHRREDTVVFHTVEEQLRELVLTVRLSHAFRMSDQYLSSVYKVRDGCRIDWESFVAAARSANADVTAEELPLFALSFTQKYFSRADRLIRSLKASRVAIAPTAHSHYLGHLSHKGGVALGTVTPLTTFLEATFLPCVSTIMIEFVSREAQLLVPTGPPSIRSGIFSDVVVLWNSMAFSSSGDFSLDAAMDVGDGVAPSRLHAHSSLVFTYQIPQLSPWVKGYFSNPGNLIVAPDRHAPLDGDDDDSSTEEEEFVPDQGDAIASERKVETQVLNIAQVVNLIYDAQHTVPVALKIGSAAIREAIDALQKCFQEGPISKHILVQIYTMNLQRLRELFVKVHREDAAQAGHHHHHHHGSSHHRRGSHANGTPSSIGSGGTNNFYGSISRHAAKKMLQDFCEYTATESRIQDELDKLEARPLTSRSGFESRAASPGLVNVAPPTSTHTSASARWAGTVMIPQLSDTVIAASGDNIVDLAPSPSAAAATYPPPVASLMRTNTATPSAIAQATPRLFDFQSVATVALCALLPYEAEMAISCRRDILWMGLEDTGKTLLMNSIRGVAQPTHPTIGLTESVTAFKEWVFGCKELGGRADFRTNWRQYMDRVDNVHAVVFVVDAGKPSSFAEAAEYLHGVSGAKMFAGLPFLIIFNNYRAGDKKVPTPQALYDSLKLHRVKRKHPLMEYVTCDVTVVHSKLNVLSDDVREGLNWLCHVFSAASTTPLPVPKIP